MTRSEVIIRRATVDDLPVTADVWDRAQIARSAVFPEEFRGAVVIGSIARRMRVDDADLLVAQIDGKIVGMALGSPAREGGKGPRIAGLAHISWVAVDPPSWGRGIATQLMQELLDTLRAKAFARVQLWTHDDNMRAQRIYERLGFVRTPKTMMDSVGAKIVHYERDI